MRNWKAEARSLVLENEQVSIASIQIYAIVYTMSTSSYLSQNGQLHSQMCPSLQPPHSSPKPPLESLFSPTIIVLDDLVLRMGKMEAGVAGVVVVGELRARNGGNLEIQGRYAGVFEEEVRGDDMVAFSLNWKRDRFVIGVRIRLGDCDNGINFTHEQLLKIGTKMVPCRKFLLLVGLVRDRSSFSFKIHMCALKMKKNMIMSLKNKANPKQIAHTLSQTDLNDNSIIKVGQFKEQIVIKNGDKNFYRTGGYFQIEKKQYEFEQQNGKPGVKTVAIKRTKNSKNGKYQQQKQKLQHELSIVQKIKDRRYILSYYKFQNDPSFIAMDFMQKNLNDIIYSKKSLPISQILQISRQLIQAVSFLHESKVVHRDLKLQNILVQLHSNKLKLKIIDFGESSLIDAPYTKNDRALGCTIPYSPIECLIDSQQGFNSPAIDLWSIPMILHELLHRTLPLYYNRNIQLQIVDGWKCDQNFTTILQHRPRTGLRALEQWMGLLVEQGLRIEQKDRLPLATMYQYIGYMSDYYMEIIQLL